jgi:hypothetical protein
MVLGTSASVLRQLEMKGWHPKPRVTAPSMPLVHPISPPERKAAQKPKRKLHISLTVMVPPLRRKTSHDAELSVRPFYANDSTPPALSISPHLVRPESRPSPSSSDGQQSGCSSSSIDEPIDWDALSNDIAFPKGWHNRGFVVKGLLDPDVDTKQLTLSPPPDQEEAEEEPLETRENVQDLLDAWEAEEEDVLDGRV